MTAIGGHHRAPGGGTDEWLTPRWIIDALGPFDLDPCAPAVQPWPTAAHRYTAAENGLLQRWAGRIFCNPPYGRAVGAWIARLAGHGRGTALVFARTETAWWFRWVWPAATALLFVEGRITFCRPDGEPAKLGHNAGGPSVLIAYGLEDADRLAESGIAGAFVPLGAGGQAVAVLRPNFEDLKRDFKSGKFPSWAELLHAIAAREGGRLDVQIAYVLVQHHPKAAANPNWQAKVRQTLQGRGFRRVARGSYELAL